MLVDLFLAPGRYLTRRFSRDRRRVRSQLRPVVRGSVVLVSVLSWIILAGLAAFMVFRFASPPLPEPKPTLVQSAEAGYGTTPAPAPASPDQASMAAAASAVAAGAGGSVLEAGSALSRPLEPPPDPPVSAGAQVWLVIVESIPKSARAEAERSLARHKKRGLALELLDTDAYPMLKSGMWTLAMGPFDTKVEADAAAAQLKPKVRDLMVRRGL